MGNENQQRTELRYTLNIIERRINSNSYNGRTICPGSMFNFSNKQTAHFPQVWESQNFSFSSLQGCTPAANYQGYDTAFNTSRLRTKLNSSELQTTRINKSIHNSCIH